MVIDARVHRADDGDVIHDACDIRQQFRDFRATRSPLAELPRAAEDFRARAADVVILHLAGEVLAIHSCQGRFGVQQVDLAGTTLHEQ